MTVLLVALGAAVGAPLRYGIDRLLRGDGSGLPWGTLAVNVTGSLLFGIITGGTVAGSVPPAVFATAGVGFCGALTTFSTFSYETVVLINRGSRRTASLNVLLSLAAGLGAAWLGLAIAESTWG